MFETLFGSEMPLAARFFIAFLVVLILIGVPIILTSYRFRATIRRTIIRVSEVIAVITIVMCTLGAGITGLAMAYMRASFSGQNEGAVVLLSIIGFLAGAMSGFVVSALTLALLFLLIEIAENSHRTVAFFERVSSRTQN
jgi:hypothetical protein